MNCYKTVELKTAKRFATGQHTRCDCLPACSSISYDAELSFAKYDLREFYRAKKKRYAQRCNYEIKITRRKLITLFISQPPIR